MRASTVVSSVLSLALLANQAVATPPACLLACVAQVTKASSTCDALNDVNCICSKQGDDVKKCLDSICPNGDAEAAYSAFKSSCSEQNVSVDNKHSSSSSSKASSSAAKTSSSSAAKTSSTEVAASSSEVAKTSSSQAAASSTKVEVTSTVSSKAEVSSTSSTTLATSSKVEEVSSSSSASSTLTVSEIHSDAGNYLQAGNTFAIAAIAALLI